MYRVLSSLVAAVVLMVPASTASALVVEGAYPPPQPFAPSNEARVTVDPEHGVGLTVLWRLSGERAFVQAWRAGGTPVEVATSHTQDLGVVTAQIPASSFTPDAPNSLFSGADGWVYWRPFVYCYDVTEETIDICPGETRSFLYRLQGAGAGARTSCARAKRRQRKAQVSLNVAQRRYGDARTMRQRRRWRRQLRRATRQARRAKHLTKRACR